jgi:hypothetical protein
MKIIFTLLFISNSWLASCINPPPNIKKILCSGDGKTIESAYNVHTIDEEYDVLEFLKLKPIVQKLQIEEGCFYDIIKTQTKTIYFKIIKKQLPNKAKQLQQT